MSKNLEEKIIKELDRKQMKGHEIEFILKNLSNDKKAESFYSYLLNNKIVKLTDIEIYKALQEI